MIFADDAIIFFKVNLECAVKMVRVLDTFMEVSGRRLNLQKLGVIFSPNTWEQVKEETRSMLSIRRWDSLVCT